MIDDALKKRLLALADKYETTAFVLGDPSFVLRHYGDKRDAEVAAFVCAMLSFGSRDQFLKKVDLILKKMDDAGGSYRYVTGGFYEKDFLHGEKCFYRMYKERDLLELFSRLKKVIERYGALGEAVRIEAQKCPALRTKLPDALGRLFCGCATVPQSAQSAKKKSCMLLRWMGRQGSPVDLGLWDWINGDDLIIPLDTHVLQSAKKLGLLEKNAAPVMKSAIKLTDELKAVFAHDGARADYALFGLDLEEKKIAKAKAT